MKQSHYSLVKTIIVLFPYNYLDYIHRRSYQLLVYKPVNDVHITVGLNQTVLTVHLFVILQITELCLDFICYDPNYNYGSDDEDEFMETDMEEEEEE